MPRQVYVPWIPNLIYQGTWEINTKLAPTVNQACGMMKNAKELLKLVDWKGSVQEDDHNELSFQEIYNFLCVSQTIALLIPIKYLQK